MSAAEYEKRDTLDGAAWPARPPRGQVATEALLAPAAAAGEGPRGAGKEVAHDAAQG